MALPYRNGFMMGLRFTNPCTNQFFGYLTSVSTRKYSVEQRTRNPQQALAEGLNITCQNPTNPIGSNLANSTNKNNASVNTKFHTCEEMMNSRKTEANRTIIVEVQNQQMYSSLKMYCSQFGNIKNVFHYKKQTLQNFFLIEFEDERSVSEIVNSATFMDRTTVVPVKSSMLWFRQKGLPVKNPSKEADVPTTVIKDAHIVEKQLIDTLTNTRGLSEQIKGVYNVLKLNETDIRLRYVITQMIEKCFTTLLPGSTVMPFGSTVSGFGMRNCDLDLVLLAVSTEIPDRAKSSPLLHYRQDNHSDARQETRKFLTIVSHTMHYFVPGIYDVVKILDARVPIVKFKHDYTATDCDLSATNETGVVMSEVLWLYGEICSATRPLCCVIRKWAEAQNLTNEYPGRWITNFSLSLMVIFFLQRKAILPSIRALRELSIDTDTRKTASGLDITFLRNSTILNRYESSQYNEMNLGVLFMEFFQFYVLFDFEKHAISLADSKIVRKVDKAALYICNPLETHLNVSKNVSDSELRRLRSHMKEALNYLKSQQTLENSNLMSLLKFSAPQNHCASTAQAVQR